MKKQERWSAFEDFKNYDTVLSYLLRDNQQKPNAAEMNWFCIHYYNELIRKDCYKTFEDTIETGYHMTCIKNPFFFCS